MPGLRDRHQRQVAFEPLPSVVERAGQQRKIVKAGKLLPSTILRRLGSYSRHNQLYQAFHELGLAVRTEFLLRFVSDLDLRRIIQAAMNKSERFNQFAQWVAFGGKGMITENDRAEQRKRIKYNHLVANCLIFHNVYEMTKALHRLLSEGVLVKEETIQHLSPYITEHINRFGVYEWNPERAAPVHIEKSVFLSFHTLTDI